MDTETLREGFARAEAVARQARARVERRTERLLARSVPTFMESELLTPEESGHGYDAVFMGVPFEGRVVKDPRTFYPQGTAPEAGSDMYARQGAWKAPEAVRQASLYFSLDHSNGFMPEKDLVLGDRLKIGDAGDVAARQMTPEEALAAASTRVEEFVREGTVPLVAGGDHLVAYFVLAGIYAAVGRKVGVVSYDSHLDLSWQPHHWAGSQWARAMELGVLDPGNLVEIGIRGLRNSIFWKQAAEELDVLYFTAADADELGMKQISERAVERALDGVDLLYISIDVDVFDPASLAAQKYPEPGGLTAREVLRSIGSILGAAIQSGAALSGFDFCELAPQYDVDCYGAALAARCFVEALGVLAAGR